MATRAATTSRPASEQASPAKPDARFAHGAVSAAIFSNDLKVKDGNTTPVYRIDLRRSFQTERGYKHTHVLRPSDIADARIALDDCDSWIQSSLNS